MDKALFRMQGGKAWPAWSVPTELLRMLFRPTHAFHAKSNEGVGWREEEAAQGRTLRTHDISEYQTPQWRKRINAFAIHVRRAQELPTSTHRSQGAFIDKHNNKIGCEAHWLIHVMCGLGRGWMEGA